LTDAEMRSRTYNILTRVICPQACQKWDWTLHQSECECLGRVRTLSSDQENPSIPPDAVRCLARISFAKVKYGLDSEIVRMNFSDDLAVRRW